MHYFDHVTAIAQQAVEPVFSISDPYSFHDLNGAYTNAFADSAFSNALICAITLTKHNCTITPDVLHYKGLAIEHINHQIQSSSSYECTIGAILLLVGVEWRTKSGDDAQVHLRGIEQMLRVYSSQNRFLSASVRRGIFWQDVNTAIMSAKNRVMDRATFPEFQWGRATFMVDWARLPSGFADLRGELGPSSSNQLEDIYILLQDISVLQMHSELLACGKPDIKSIHDMDNMQACIESRLIEQLQVTHDNVLRMAVLLTAYLYTYCLFTQIWNGSSIPLRIATRLLEQLQILTCDSLEGPKRSVILWCIFVAGCLIPEGPTRTSYGVLLQLHFGDVVLASSFNAAWFAIFGTLDKFLWSQVNFGSRAIGFLRDNIIILSPPAKSPAEFDEQVQGFSNSLSTGN